MRICHISYLFLCLAGFEGGVWSERYTHSLIIFIVHHIASPKLSPEYRKIEAQEYGPDGKPKRDYDKPHQGHMYMSGITENVNTLVEIIRLGQDRISL